MVGALFTATSPLCCDELTPSVTKWQAAVPARKLRPQRFVQLLAKCPQTTPYESIASATFTKAARLAPLT